MSNLNGTREWLPHAFEDIEPIAEAIWDSLAGDTHSGQPWDDVSMRAYGGTCDVRNRVYRMAKAVYCTLIRDGYFD